ncbi:hypothetical protein VTO42DRAFT_4278 [Malbranchea cinnamomea]
MLPPSDSICHHNRKLAEFVSHLRTQTAMAASPPPPPYAARSTDFPCEELLGPIEDVDDDTCGPAPIVIKIDTSIYVEGHANTVAIPSSLTSRQGDGHQSPSTENVLSTQTASNLPQLQQQRQAKSAQLATSVIAALRSSGALEDAESGRQRPLEVNINAAIRINGNGNAVCAGIRRPGQPLWSPLNSHGGRKRRAMSVPVEGPISSKRSCR